MTKFKILIPIIVVVAVGGTLLSLYTKTWNPLWNPFYPPRETVVRKAVVKLAEADSFKGQGDINLEIEEVKDEETTNFNAVINFSGGLDRSDVGNPKSSSDFKITLGTAELSFSFTGELRSIEGAFYCQIKTLPEIPFLLGSLEEVKGQWFKVDPKMFQQELTSEEEAIQEEKAREMMEEFIKILKGKEIIQVEKDLGVEQIDGVESSHYLVLLKEEAIKEVILEFLPELKKYLPEEEKTQYEEKLDEIMTELPNNLDEFFVQVGEIKFEVWLSNDGWLRRIKGEKEIDLSGFEQLKESLEGEVRVKISFDVKLFDFNQKIEVEAPQEFKSLEEILPPGILTPFYQQGTMMEMPESSLPSSGEESGSLPEGVSAELPSQEEIEEMERLLEELEQQGQFE